MDLAFSFGAGNASSSDDGRKSKKDKPKKENISNFAADWVGFGGGSDDAFGASTQTSRSYHNGSRSVDNLDSGTGEKRSVSWYRSDKEHSERTEDREKGSHHVSRKAHFTDGFLGGGGSKQVQRPRFDDEVDRHRQHHDLPRSRSNDIYSSGGSRGLPGQTSPLGDDTVRNHHYGHDRHIQHQHHRHPHHGHHERGHHHRHDEHQRHHHHHHHNHHQHHDERHQHHRHHHHHHHHRIRHRSASPHCGERHALNQFGDDRYSWRESGGSEDPYARNEERRTSVPWSQRSQFELDDLRWSEIRQADFRPRGVLDRASSSRTLESEFPYMRCKPRTAAPNQWSALHSIKPNWSSRPEFAADFEHSSPFRWKTTAGSMLNSLGMLPDYGRTFNAGDSTDYVRLQARGGFPELQETATILPSEEFTGFSRLGVSEGPGPCAAYVPPAVISGSGTVIQDSWPIRGVSRISDEVHRLSAAMIPATSQARPPLVARSRFDDSALLSPRWPPAACW